MGVSSVRLETVRRNAGGRVHLTPRVPRSGPVTTLCGQTLAAGTYSAFDGVADCSICIRRSRDQGRISGAFFAQEEGSELLRLSLEQAQQRKRPEPKGPPALRVVPDPKPQHPDGPVEWPKTKPPPEPIPDRLGELVTRGFRPAGEGVWRSPGGVVVKMKREGKQWRFAELVFEGTIVATRVVAGLRVRAGDVEVVPSSTGFEVQLKKR
ncbi:MAG: hypothetical protein ABI334_06865 [Candidatus Dormiibacterota bacterium]